MAQEGEKLDKDALMREAMVGQRKERMELERKVQSQARKADHLERARREEEGPLLQATYERRLEVCPLAPRPCPPSHWGGARAHSCSSPRAHPLVPRGLCVDGYAGTLSKYRCHGVPRCLDRLPMLFSHC